MTSLFRRQVLAIGFSAACGGSARAALPPSRPEDRVAIVRRFFQLLDEKNISAWIELWAADGRILIPYPPDGVGPSLDGRQAIRAAFDNLFAQFETFRSEITALYPASDSDAVCVEYAVRARFSAGAEYTNSNIAVFRFENGLIHAYHDYFDPRRFQAVINALPKP